MVKGNTGSVCFLGIQIIFVGLKLTDLLAIIKEIGTTRINRIHPIGLIHLL
jgi:hypothetical protein